MSDAARSLAPSNAADKIADALLELAGRIESEASD